MKSNSNDWEEINDQCLLFSKYLQSGILKLVKELENLKGEKISILQLYFGFSDDIPFLLGCDRLSFYKYKAKKESGIQQIGTKDKILTKILKGKSMHTKSTQMLKKQIESSQSKATLKKVISPPVNKKSFSIFAQDTTLAAKYDAYTIKKQIMERTTDQDGMQSFIDHPELNDDDVLGENFGAFKKSIFNQYNKPTSALLDRGYSRHSRSTPYLKRQIQSHLNMTRKVTPLKREESKLSKSIFKQNNASEYMQVQYKCPGKFCNLRIICNDANLTKKSYMVETDLLLIDKSEAYKIIKCMSPYCGPKLQNKNEDDPPNPLTFHITDSTKNECMDLIFIKKKLPQISIKKAKTPISLPSSSLVRVCYKCYLIYSKISARLRECTHC